MFNIREHLLNTRLFSAIGIVFLEMKTGQSLCYNISRTQTNSLNANSLRQMPINLDIGTLKVI